MKLYTLTLACTLGLRQVDAGTPGLAQGRDPLVEERE
jgi:hypothetical protein